MSNNKRNTNVEVNKESEESLKIWDCGSPLYDSYELACVSHLIERHLMKHPYINIIGGGSKRFIMYQHSPTSTATISTLKAAPESRRKNGGCMGSFMLGRKKIGERSLKKIKGINKKFRAIKCFM